MAVKISELPKATSASADDLLLIVDSPVGGAITKNITVRDFFSNVFSSVVVQNNVSISKNITANTGNSYFSNLHISYTSSPSTSFWSTEKGQIWFDADYLYVATDTNHLKRAPLVSFSGNTIVPTAVSVFMNDILDANTVSAVANDVLVYDGTEWVPQILTKDNVVLSLDDLTNSNSVVANVDEVLVYDGVAWNPKILDSNNVSIPLSELTDTNVGTAVANDVLVFDGTNWVPQILTKDNVTLSLDNLTDANTSVVSTNQALVWNGTEWNPKSLDANNVSLTLNELTDVNTTGASVNQVLTYNGASWAPGTFTTPPQAVASVYLASNTLTLTTGWNKLAFDTVDYDTNSFWNAASKRFIPTIAGYYSVSARIAYVINPYPLQMAVYKNGAIHKAIGPQGTMNAGSGETVVYCNGTTDYIELFYNTSTSYLIDSNKAQTYFELKGPVKV